MKKVQEDLFLLKTEQENQKQLANAVQKEKLKSSKLMRRHKKLASKVQDMKETVSKFLHKTSLDDWGMEFYTGMERYRLIPDLFRSISYCSKRPNMKPKCKASWCVLVFI